uniref:Uncharacterized protein n=1 Tax=Panagrolaimus sp. ES5 TaxID=591445 RepID=A0AC34FMU7_9BILA
MQLPSASTHHSQSMSAVPAHYNSYFSSTPHSRPIQINAPSTAARFVPYNNSERVMGLDFDEPTTNEISTTNIDSVYLMDFMDDENPPTSSSITNNPLHHTDSIENALRRAALSTVNEDDKENGTKTTAAATTTTTSPPSAPSPIQAREISNIQIFENGTKTTAAATTTTTSPPSASSPIQARELSNIQIFGEPGSQNFKLQNSYDDENLLNEETESEAGFSGEDDCMISGEDDCMSNCGCVHSCIGSPIDFAPPTAILDCYNNVQQPFTRLGFRSVGDIIGYAKVVKAERLEALAELRNAVEKFNDMRQRKNNQNLPKFNPTN